MIPSAGSPGPLALDVGCGSKPFDLALRARGYRPIGIDLNSDGVEIRGQAERLPIKDGAATLALCVNVLQYLPRPLDACREIYRSLARGGKFVVCLPTVSPFDRLDHWRWTGIVAAEMLEQAGFEEVVGLTVGSTPMNLLHLMALTARKRLPLLGEPIGGMLELAAAAAPPARGHQALPLGYVLRGMRPS